MASSFSEVMEVVYGDVNAAGIIWKTIRGSKWTVEQIILSIMAL